MYTRKRSGYRSESRRLLSGLNEQQLRATSAFVRGVMGLEEEGTAGDLDTWYFYVKVFSAEIGETFVLLKGPSGYPEDLETSLREISQESGLFYKGIMEFFKGSIDDLIEAGRLGLKQTSNEEGSPAYKKELLADLSDMTLGGLEAAESFFSPENKGYHKNTELTNRPRFTFMYDYRHSTVFSTDELRATVHFDYSSQ